MTLFCVKHFETVSQFMKCPIFLESLYESLVSKIRKNSCALIQLDMELRVGWAMGERAGVLSQCLYSPSSFFLLFPLYYWFSAIWLLCFSMGFSSAWGSLSFLHLWVFSFCLIWKIFRIFFKIFFLYPLPSQNPISCLLSHRSLMLGSFFPVVFLSVLYFAVISISMSSSSLIIFSAVSDLLLIPSSVF